MLRATWVELHLSSNKVCLKGGQGCMYQQFRIVVESTSLHPLRSVNIIQSAQNANYWPLSQYPPFCPVPLNRCIKVTLLGSWLSLLTIMANSALPQWLVTGPRNQSNLEARLLTTCSPAYQVTYTSHLVSERQNQDLPIFFVLSHSVSQAGR